MELTFEVLLKKCEQTNIGVSGPEIKFIESQTKNKVIPHFGLGIGLED